MTQRTSLAVIIVNWNSSKLLRQCLQALKEQSTQAERVLVIDNASTDSPLNFIEDEFPEVELHRLDKNTGFAAANNFAVAMVENCAWVALLNPDAFPQKNWLEHLRNAVERAPEFSSFASNMISFENPEIIDGVGDVYHKSGLTWRRFHGQKINAVTVHDQEVFSACAGAALYKRDAFLEVGGFDETFFCYIEDIDLGFRLRLMGHKCLFVADAVVYHIGSASTGRESDFSIYHTHRNLIWTYIKNMPGVIFWQYLPLHLLMNIAFVLYYLFKGRGRIIFKAKKDALSELKQRLKERKKIQAARKANIVDFHINRETFRPRRFF